MSNPKTVTISGRFFPKIRDDVGVQGLLNDFAKHAELFPAHAFEEKWGRGWIVYGDLIGISSTSRISRAVPLNQVAKFQSLNVAASKSVPCRNLIQFSDSTFATFTSLQHALMFASRVMHLCMALNYDTLRRRVAPFHEMIMPSFGVAYGQYFVGRISSEEDDPELLDHLRVVVGEGITDAVKLQESAALMGTIALKTDEGALKGLKVSPPDKSTALVQWLSAMQGEGTNRLWSSLRLLGPDPLLWPWFFTSARQTASQDAIRASQKDEYAQIMRIMRAIIHRWVDSFFVGVTHGPVPPTVAKHGFGLARYVASCDQAFRNPKAETVRPTNWRKFLSQDGGALRVGDPS